MDSVKEWLIHQVESTIQQLDPEWTWSGGIGNVSPRAYFSKYGVRDYIRIIAIIGAYALIVRPLLEKVMSKLRDRATGQGKGPTPIAVDLPAWEKDPTLAPDGTIKPEDPTSDDPFDWGAKARRRQREIKRAIETREQDDEDAEINKYLD
ncbi:hypothetical protein PYCC9005_001830 [Savitreella phatthalungensis]